MAGSSELGATRRLDDEIGLLEIWRRVASAARIVWARRRMVLSTAAVGAILGVLYALGAPVEYKSSMRVLPYGSSVGTGALGGLAGLAGLRLPAGAGEKTITAALYPDIVRTIDFQLALADHSVWVGSEARLMSVREYFLEVHKPSITQVIARNTVGLPRRAKSFVSALLKPASESDGADSVPGLLFVPFEERLLLAEIESRLNVTIDEQTGIVTLTGRMPDRAAAAAFAVAAAELVMKVAIEFDSKKASEELQFVEARRDESKARVEQLRSDLVSFQERNRNATSARVLAEIARLESELALHSEVYRQLSAEVSQVQLKKSQDTPVFSVIQHAVVPNERSSPNRTLIVWFAGLAGILVGAGRALWSSRGFRAQSGAM